MVYSDSASRRSRTLLIRQIYTRWLEARGLSEGECLPGDLSHGEGLPYAEGMQEVEGLSGGQRPSPCRRRTLRLGRRPKVQLQSTRTAAFSKHTKLHIHTLRNGISLAHSLYILLSLYLYLCLCVYLSLTQTLSHTQKGGKTETEQ